jgi:nucleoside-diphosphate-sugar epimerase
LRSAPRIGPRIAALTRSLQADDGATRAAFGWTPPVPTAEGLARTARAFVAESRSGR